MTRKPPAERRRLLVVRDGERRERVPLGSAPVANVLSPPTQVPLLLVTETR